MKKDRVRAARADLRAKVASVSDEWAFMSYFNGSNCL
jgi:hypothetical protein